MSPVAPELDFPAAFADPWYVVVSTMPSGGVEPRTFRALASFDSDGALSLSGSVSTDDALFEEFLNPEFCVGRGGEFRIETRLGQGFSASGHVSKSSHLLVFGNGEHDKSLGLGLPIVGTSSQVNGTYRVVMTTTDANGQIIVWRGRLIFALGCIQAGSGLEPMDGAGSLELIDPGVCLTPTSEGLFELEVTSRFGIDEHEFRWFGAVGPRGEALLFTDRTSNLKYGTIIAIREFASATTSLVAGPWVFQTHRRDVATGVASFATGRINHLADRSLGGMVANSTGALLSGTWGLSDTGGKYSNNLRYDGLVFDHAGAFGAGQDVIVGWRVDTGTAAVPDIFDKRPSEPSMFIAIRPMTFE